MYLVSSGIFYNYISIILDVFNQYLRQLFCSYFNGSGRVLSWILSPQARKFKKVRVEGDNI